jgi:putative ABC transport system permease protein
VIAPRFRKLLRDVWTERGRVAVMIVAVAVSVMGIGAVLGSFSILGREMPRNYLGTRPASAALELTTDVDAELLAEVRRRPDVAEADAGEIVLARAKVGPDWIPILLFVVDDFERMRLNVFTPESGAWPPPKGTMLIERTAVRVLGAGEGGSVIVKAPHGVARSISVSGIVHDPGVAPAWQERTGYGYITRETLALLGEAPELHELRIATRARPFDAAAVQATAGELSRWLSERGRKVDLLRVPPPGRHPHQTQMQGVMFLLLVFSAMALVLSGVLVASSMAAMLSRQVREIGVMKTIGAETRTIASMYVLLVAALGVVAVALAIPAGAAAAQGLAGMTGRMLNLTLASTDIPVWVFGVQAAAGVIVPVLVALVPILRASRTTVRDALDRHGATGPRTWSSTVSIGSLWLGRIPLLAIRNAFRRRTRLALAVLMLSAGGAMLLTAIGMSRGWERIVERVYENRSYDVEVRLNAPAVLAEQLRSDPRTRVVEAWGYGRAAVIREGDVDVVRTYPDGGHGSLSMLGPPPSTKLVDFPLLAGRWLRQGDEDSVVLNHMAQASLPGVGVGSVVTLSLEGRPSAWRVVGIVEEVGSAGVAYVSDTAFARVAGTGQGTRMLRIATTATSPEVRAELVRAIERRLEEAGASVEVVIPLAVLRTAMGDHVIVLIGLLLGMAALMLTVAVLGLISTMGTNVVERTREIGVMKAIGGSSRQIAGLVVGEALVMALASWVVGTVLSVPLTLAVGTTVGQLAFRIRLPYVLDHGAVAAWLLLLLVIASVAALLPARRAGALTIREALAHV